MGDTQMNIRDTALRIAFEELHKPYVYGSNGTDDWDCSGFLMHILRHTGHVPPTVDWTAQGIHDKLQQSSSPARQAGSLVFYGADLDHITHCAMAINQFAIIGANGGSIKKVSVEKINYHRYPIVAILDVYGGE